MKNPLLLLVASAMMAHGAAKVEFSNDAATELLDARGLPLSAGDLATPHDGAPLQLGYFDQATVANPFLGRWIPLTGDDSHNDWASTIGDEEIFGRSPSPGRFALSVFFLRGTEHGNDLPPFGDTPLAIRFYDGASVASSTHYNAVSNTTGAWNYTDTFPGTSTFIKLSDAGLVWEGGAASAFRTTVPLPEPSAALLLLLGVNDGE